VLKPDHSRRAKHCLALEGVYANHLAQEKTASGVQTAVDVGGDPYGSRTRLFRLKI
jgi:hypothetical protein